MKAGSKKTGSKKTSCQTSAKPGWCNRRCQSTDRKAWPMRPMKTGCSPWSKMDFDFRVWLMIFCFMFSIFQFVHSFFHFYISISMFDFHFDVFFDFPMFRCSDLDFRFRILTSLLYSVCSVFRLVDLDFLFVFWISSLDSELIVWCRSLISFRCLISCSEQCLEHNVRNVYIKDNV